MSARVRLTVPERALGGLTQTLLEVGVAAAVLEHLGEPADIALIADSQTVVHVTAQTDRTTADALVQAVGSWLDGVLGPEDPDQPRRARVELEIPLHPQLPQGNPLFGRPKRVTPVTTWG